MMNNLPHDHSNDQAHGEEEPHQSMAANHMSLLRDGCLQMGVPLSDRQVEQFETYYRALTQWNQKFNLTAITEYDEVQVKHFLDSLAGLPLLAEELGTTLPFQLPLHLADVGAGAGFPSIPIKIAAPSLKPTLIDGTLKKIRFLTHLRQTLTLEQTEIVQGRAEELGRQSNYREQFELVTARAVAPLNTLVEYILPLTRVGGLALLYKGGNAPQEFIDARRAIQELGGETTRFAPVVVPFLNQQRFILLIKKVRQTPHPYPRGQGLARKKPL